MEASVFTDVMTPVRFRGAEKETAQEGRRRVRATSVRQGKRIRTALENVKKTERGGGSAVRLGGKRQVLIGFARRTRGWPLVKEKQPSVTVQRREGREKTAALTDHHVGLGLQTCSLLTTAEQLQ